MLVTGARCVLLVVAVGATLATLLSVVAVAVAVVAVGAAPVAVGAALVMLLSVVVLLLVEVALLAVLPESVPPAALTAATGVVALSVDAWLVPKATQPPNAPTRAALAMADFSFAPSKGRREVSRGFMVILFLRLLARSDAPACDGLRVATPCSDHV